VQSSGHECKAIDWVGVFDIGIQKLNVSCLSFIKISITLSACASYPMVKVVKCYLFVDHGHHSDMAHEDWLVDLR
jgi:hypothetical protein